MLALVVSLTLLAPATPGERSGIDFLEKSIPFRVSFQLSPRDR